MQSYGVHIIIYSLRGRYSHTHIMNKINLQKPGAHWPVPGLKVYLAIPAQTFLYNSIQLAIEHILHAIYQLHSYLQAVVDLLLQAVVDILLETAIDILQVLWGVVDILLEAVVDMLLEAVVDILLEAVVDILLEAVADKLQQAVADILLWDVVDIVLQTVTGMTLQLAVVVGV